MTKMYLLIIAMLSLNCMAADKSKIKKRIVKELDSCIREVQEAQKKQKEFRESKGPFDQLFHFVDSLKYDSFSKTLIGLMEEVKYSVEGSVQGTKTKKGKLSKKQLAKFEYQLRENHFSRKFLKNKKHFRQFCYEERNSLNQEVQFCEYDSNLTIDGLHKTLKVYPNTFCSIQSGFHGPRSDEYRYKSLDDMQRGSDLIRFAQKAYDESNPNFEDYLLNPEFYNPQAIDNIKQRAGAVFTK